MNISTSYENKVQILLAVWGEKFIKDFLQYGLPSLLAPQNIEAIAKAYQTTFVILTKSEEVDVFEQSLAFQTLKSMCDILFVPINDLISIGNHSTTLTYAYDRAIRNTKDEMLHTYFVLLNADYIFAEGSFKGLMQYMDKGYSAICAGNFQVVENEIKPILKNYLDPINQVLSISPRELLKKSFQHFHPVTLACMLNQEHLHNYRANRFFLRYDRETLAGRFYLLHVLCIKPETKDYDIGASFDYSFIPEMCPSKNIGVINDSDDYLVIEMQPKKHELKNVHFGPFKLKKLVSCLTEWTTNEHRNNVKHIIYYHTNDITAEIKHKIQTKSDQFINELRFELEKYKAKPHRGHPYWVGAVSAFKNAKSFIKNNDSLHYLDLSPLDSTSTFRKMYYRLLGYPPSVNRFHYRWQEFVTTKAVIQQFAIPGRDFLQTRNGQSSNRGQTLALYSANEKEFVGYFRWLKKDLKIEHHFHFHTVVNTKSLSEDLQRQQFERCVFFMRVAEIKKIKQFLTVIKSILAPQANILIFILNGNNDSPTFLYNFPNRFLSEINRFNSVGYTISRITTIHSHFSLLGTMTIKWINMKFDYSKKWRFLFYFLFGMPGMLLTFIRNRLFGNKSSKNAHCTSILVTLAPEN